MASSNGFREGPPMEMHQVRYFLALSEELNFTRAAERCNVAQPSLTRAIRLLEDELGGPLFHRERANTHLSELGRMVKPYLEQVAAQAAAAKRNALDFTKLKRAVLKLGVMCTLAPANLLELVRALAERHPGIEVQIVDAQPGALCERLAAGDLEVAITCHPREAADDRFHLLPLFREPFVIALPPAHPLAERNAVRVRDLDGERYLERSHCEHGAVAEAIFAEQGVQDVTVYRSDRDDWILAMVAAGMGYAFLPEQCAFHPDIAVRRLVEPEIWREVNLVTVRGRPHSAAVGALVREAVHAPWRKAVAPRLVLAQA